jgi:probable H4MPT-linked C1 transfer pathway protein
MSTTLGWDIGGAHVKLVALDEAAAIKGVMQRQCELWLGIDRLEAILENVPVEEDTIHAITMTGELADIFPDRASGVYRILEAFSLRFGSAQALVYTHAGFVSAQEAPARWMDVASANWRASAELVAKLIPEALVIDVGSTTCDITIVSAGELRSLAKDDYGRLAKEELIYTGVVRTPLMALAARAPFGGEWVGMMAEHFATTADVFRVLGRLDCDFDHAATADGRPRTIEDSMRRLARMIGCDVAQANAEDWVGLARWFADRQRARIREACERQLSRGLLKATAPVIGLGVGAFLAADVARELNRDYSSFAELAGVPAVQRSAVDVCGPAYAVARLARSSLAS